MKVKRILAAVAAFALIAVILLVANSFVGNPVSAFLANRAAEQYLSEAYPDMELDARKASYSFKDGLYHVHVQSPKSIDTRFSLTFTGWGKLRTDDYEYYVENKFNTWQRLDTEYRELTDAVFENEFPYPSDIAYGELFRNMESMEFLEFDRIYDIKALAKEHGNLVLYVDTKELTAAAMAEILQTVKARFDAKDVPFASIDLSLKNPEDIEGTEYLQVENFLYEDISRDDLLEYLPIKILETEQLYQERDKEKEKELYENSMREE